METKFRATLKRSDEDQLKFRDYVQRHRDFTAEEKAALSIDSVLSFQKAWDVAAQAKTTTEERRRRGRKRIGQSVQNFAVAASDIVTCMGPILELVKDIGAPYGGMAIGTVSFLFTVSPSYGDDPSLGSKPTRQIT